MNNLVFDLGGVVLDWNPKALIADCFSSPFQQDLVWQQVCTHPDWAELDRGTLEEKAAIARAVERTGLTLEQIRHFFAQIPRVLVPVPTTLNILNNLKQKGNRLYCLSNMHRAAIFHLDRAYSFWPVFDGRVISCQVHSIKPEPAIYRCLIEKFDLDPNITTFVDDLVVNLKAASQFGWQTILFENPSQCQQELLARGLL